MANTVWLARHGNRQDFVDPAWRETAEWPHDPGLSPDGWAQAERLGERLRKEHIAAIFASPFLRTVQTAHVVAETLDLAVFLEPGMAEWMNTAWFPEAPRLRSYDELARHYPRLDLRYQAQGAFQYPETEEQAWARAGRTARMLAGSHAEPIMVVGHGSSLTGAANGLLDRTGSMECALCSLFRIGRTSSGAWMMELDGDVAHLERAEAADRYH